MFGAGERFFLRGAIFQFRLGITVFFATQHNANYVRSKKTVIQQKLENCAGGVFGPTVQPFSLSGKI